MYVLLITRLLRGVGRWARKPVNHTSWMAVVTPTDRPKSIRNRCLIELFCGVVCVVTFNRFSVVIHTYNVLSHSWDYISSGTRGPVTSVSLHLVILKEIISIKTYSPIPKKIVNTCPHSNITV